MPFKNSEERKRWFEKYYKENKNQINTKCREYHQEHRKEINKRKRSKYFRGMRTEYQRRTCLYTDGKQIYGLNKRPHPGYCELCGKSPKKLSYHHWDEKELSKGIWICPRCHWVVEAYEKNDLGVIQKYLRIKRVLNRQYKNKKKIKPELN